MSNINGTANSELLEGTSGNDYINGNGGSDSIYGYAGNDVLSGSSSSEVVYGGSGNDTIYGNGGSDLIFGGSGNDTIYAGAGYDTIFGGSGNDVIYSNGGGDYIDSGTGVDTLWLGGKETVALSQGSGYDVVNNFQVHAGSQNQFDISSYGISYGQLSFTDTANGVEISTTAGDLLAVVANQKADVIGQASNFV
jgi:Ca2+-binding RTX toxin-like protein